MTGALMQDQWEAGLDMILQGHRVRAMPAAPDGYVPVPPAVMTSAVHRVYMLELKEDE